MEPILTQGSGKVRLTAAKGIFRDSEALKRHRELIDKSNIQPPPRLGGAVGLPPVLVQDAPPQVVAPPLIQAPQPTTQAPIAIRQTKAQETQRTLDAAQGDYYVEFATSPEMSESGSVMYAEISDIRAAASILWYQGTPSRNFSINAKLVSRTRDEAAYNARIIHVLKSWRMPETLRGQGGIGKGTPTVLYLQGYGDMYKDIPVVMTDLSIEFPSEHDYIRAGDSIVPIITQVSISLKEAHSLAGAVGGPKSSIGEPFKQFDIVEYRSGTLKGW